MFTDFFLALSASTNRKTVAEVQGVIAEGNTQIAYLVQTVESYLMSQVRRYMTIMVEQDKLPEPPNVIKQAVKSGDRFGIRFIGPLSKARRFLYTVGQDMRMVQGVVAPLADIDQQAVLDRFDSGEMISRAQQFMSGGKSVIRTPEEAEEIKRQREFQQMMMMRAQMAMEALKQDKRPEVGSPSESVMSGNQ